MGRAVVFHLIFYLNDTGHFAAGIVSKVIGFFHVFRRPARFQAV